MIPAAGHNYQDGVCTNCGAQEPSAGSENVFGETAGTIESGSRYALVTSSSTQNFALTVKKTVRSAGRKRRRQPEQERQTAWRGQWRSRAAVIDFHRDSTA